MTDHNPIPLLLTGALSIFAVYVAFLLGVLIERRRWRDYHRAVMAGLQAHIVTAPPLEELDFEQINEELNGG